MPDIIIPPRQQPVDDRGYFEILVKAVFQAGFSWQVVERKWPGFGSVFERFDVARLATWNQDKVLEAVESPLIIRNLRKIEAVVYNAKQVVGLIDEYGSFGQYMAAIRDEGYTYVSKQLQQQFKWLGRTGAYFFLWCVDEDVPPWENR